LWKVEDIKNKVLRPNIPTFTAPRQQSIRVGREALKLQLIWTSDIARYRLYICIASCHQLPRHQSGFLDAYLCASVCKQNRASLTALPFALPLSHPGIPHILYLNTHALCSFRPGQLLKHKLCVVRFKVPLKTWVFEAKAGYHSSLSEN